MCVHAWGRITRGLPVLFSGAGIGLSLKVMR